MSNKTNKPTTPVTRAEFAAIKAQLKEKTLSEVSKAVGRNEATVRRIRRSSSYVKYQAIIKGYAANRKARTAATPVVKAAEVKPRMPATKPAVKAAPKKQRVFVADSISSRVTPTLIEKLNAPEKRSKKHATEVLELRTEIERLNGTIRQLELAKKVLRRELDGQIAENIRVSIAAKKNRSWTARFAGLRRKGDA